MKPTEKQLKFIKIIETEWGYQKFTGETMQEAKEYISKCVEYENVDELEDECNGYGMPNQ